MALQRMNEHTKKKKPSDWIYRLSSSCDWFLHVSRTYPYYTAVALSGLYDRLFFASGFHGHTKKIYISLLDGGIKQATNPPG
jgi:hypothetical protein